MQPDAPKSDPSPDNDSLPSWAPGVRAIETSPDVPQATPMPPGANRLTGCAAENQGAFELDALLDNLPVSGRAKRLDGLTRSL